MSNVINFDSSINTFLTNLIDSKNNQTKEDILTGKIIFPEYNSNINKKTSFKNEDTILLQNQLFRKYKINLYSEVRAKLERNISNYEYQIMNLKNLNKSVNLKMNEKQANIFKSNYLPSTPNLNQNHKKKIYKLKSDILNKEDKNDDSSKRAYSNYQLNEINNQKNQKKIISKQQIKNNNQFILSNEKRSISNHPDYMKELKNNESSNKNLKNNKFIDWNKNNDNKLLNSFNKSVQFQRTGKEVLLSNKYKTEYINQLSSSIEKDILKYDMKDKDYDLALNARIFVRKLKSDKNNHDILKRKRKINEYNKQMDKDLKNYYDKQKQAKINHDLIRSMENDLKANKFQYLEKKYVNKKYHYYTPSSSRIKNYNKNQLSNQLKDYSENTRSLNNAYPNINKYQFLNIETYDNYPIRYNEEEVHLYEDNNYYNIDDNAFENESLSMLDNTNKRSPYYFNEPKYNFTIEKRLEEIKQENETKKKPAVPKIRLKINSNNNKETNEKWKKNNENMKNENNKEDDNENHNENKNNEIIKNELNEDNNNENKLETINQEENKKNHNDSVNFYSNENNNNEINESNNNENNNNEINESNNNENNNNEINESNNNENNNNEINESYNNENNNNEINESYNNENNNNEINESYNNENINN